MGKGRGTRKAELKKKGMYVNPRETWALDCTIAKFVLPRLKKFKDVSLTYPGIDEADTPEKWDAILDKMILAFEYVVEDDWWWFENPRYDATLDLGTPYVTTENGERVFSEEKWESIEAEIKKRNLRRDEVQRQKYEAIEEGLQLFAKWYLHLGW